MFRTISTVHANKNELPKEVISLRDSWKIKGERDLDATCVVFALESEVLLKLQSTRDGISNARSLAKPDTAKHPRDTRGALRL